MLDDLSPLDFEDLAVGPEERTGSGGSVDFGGSAVVLDFGSLGVVPNSEEKSDPWVLADFWVLRDSVVDPLRGEPVGSPVMLYCSISVAES